MIHILSWTTKKHKKKLLSRPLHSKLKKIQGLFKEKWNSRTFQGLPLKFKDFSSRLCEPCNGGVVGHIAKRQSLQVSISPEKFSSPPFVHPPNRVYIDKCNYIHVHLKCSEHALKAGLP